MASIGVMAIFVLVAGRVGSAHHELSLELGVVARLVAPKVVHSFDLLLEHIASKRAGEAASVIV